MGNDAEHPAEWAQFVRGLRTRFRTKDFATGLALVNEFGAAAEAADHHPDITLTYGHVDVLLFSHDVGDVTERDHRLAAEFSRLALARSVSAEPAALSVLEWGLDTSDAAQIAPFWAAVLNMKVTDDRYGDSEIVASASEATIWFQKSDPHEPPRQRFHLDVWVEPREARTRIDAAVAAGGRLVSDEHAPSFWVLADAQGNHACVCTAEGR